MAEDNGYENALKLIDGLVDGFMETNAPLGGGVVTGYGHIDGRAVYIYCQYGAVSAVHARKIALLYKSALTMGAPVVALLDSGGVCVSGGADVLAAYGEILTVISNASGVIPQICAVLGLAAGLAAVIPALSDFTFVLDKKSLVMLDSPATLPGIAGKSMSPEDFGGGARVVSAGIAHFLYNDVGDLFSGVKKLLSYIPSNNLDGPPFHDDNAEDAPGGFNANDMAGIIRSVCDKDSFFEISASYEKSMIVGLSRIGGSVVGIIGASGALTSRCCEKAAKFICFCDAFNIPAVILLNAGEGFVYETYDRGDTIKSCARIVSALTGASVPKIGVITGDSYGAPLVLFNLALDSRFIWENARAGAMSEEAAAKIAGAEINTDAKEIGGFLADMIIKPEETRAHILRALDMLAAKRAAKIMRKHTGAGM